MPINETIFFVGLMRSGHHAVLNWFARNRSQPVLHYNDCKIHDGRLLPHMANLVTYYHGTVIKYFLIGAATAEHALRQHCGAAIKRYPVETLDYASASALRETSATIIYSFEERDSTYIQAAAKLAQPDHIVTVVRDPLNFIASSIRHAEKNPELRPKLVGNMHRRLVIWHQHARQLEDDEAPCTAINYNHWFRRPDYRDAVANRYGFINQGIGLEEVLLFGKGSSFDDLRHDADASRMRVLDRWEAYLHDAVFRGFLTSDLLRRSEIQFDVRCCIEL
jgi:hypothetical protein